MIDTDIPDTIREKAAAFATSPIASIVHITDGSINETYEVTMEDGGMFVLQRMSSIFGPSVMHNLALVQPALQEARVLIPEGMKTVQGDGYVLNGEGVWYRALSYIPGRTIHNHISPKGAYSAGQLAGRFHSALAKADFELEVAIRHFHDTPFYMNRLQKVLDEQSDREKDTALRPIAEELLNRYQKLNFNVSSLSDRIIHADLKVSNIRFAPNADEAIALIDMDTMMRGTVAVEMGDALRSWCGTAGEDDAEQVFDIEICKAALRGYRETAESISEEEIQAIPDGIALLTLELATRFLTDAFEETYFALSSHYPTLYEQNKTRAANQLRFLDVYEEMRREIEV